jgi:hypothetical protein
MNMLFCTALVDDEKSWRRRYRSWIDQHLPLLKPDLVFILDDAGAYRPPDRDVLVVEAAPETPIQGQVYLLKFAERAGRRSMFDFPGWWRSFDTAVDLALKYHVDRLIHVESDARVFSQRMADAMRRVPRGWASMWCPSYRAPEPSIQIIHRDTLAKAAAFRDVRATLDLEGRGPELALPFTHVEGRMIGDRYREFNLPVPADADYACQIFGGGQ